MDRPREPLAAASTLGRKSQSMIKQAQVDVHGCSHVRTVRVYVCVWKRECEREKESMLYLFSRGPQLLLCYAAVHASTAYQQCRHHHQQSLSQAHILNWTRGKAAVVFRVSVCEREKGRKRESVCVWVVVVAFMLIHRELKDFWRKRERGIFVRQPKHTYLKQNSLVRGFVCKAQIIPQSAFIWDRRRRLKEEKRLPSPPF